MEYDNTSKASTRAKRKYNEKTYDRLYIVVDKGNKDIIEQHAKIKDNGSINGFVNRAIIEAMERDNKADTVDNIS